MTQTSSCRGTRRHGAAALMLLLTATACTHMQPGRSISGAVSQAPAVPWSPPPAAKMPEAPPSKLEIPPEYLKPGTTFSLAQLVDVGLRNNPTTREAWHFARAAAAEVGVKQAEFFPYVELDGAITREKQTALGG